MGVVKGKCKRNVILKAWRSFGARSGNEKGEIATPNGCFSVYVGPQKQRFIVKTKFVNHPLFKMLLDEAEMEYGFQSDGPIWLPCNVDLFYKVLAEMSIDEEDNNVGSRRSLTMVKGFSFFVLRSPARFLCMGHGAYSVMDSEMLKINRFQY